MTMESAAAYQALALAIINLALSLWALVRSLRRPLSLSLMFWLTSIYFVGFCLVVDSCAVVCGYVSEWSEILRSVDTNYPYIFDGPVLLRVAIFTLGLNAIV